MLRSFYLLQETARGYGFTQLFGFPTIRRYQALIRGHIPRDPNRSILEIGCGIGSARDLFVGDYTGIDINPEYIRTARQKFSGRFLAMDAAELSFAPNEFDDAVSIATTHHLTDEQLAMMIRNSLIVAPRIHIIDAILPISPNDWFKHALFRMDRGRYARTFDQLSEIVSRHARIEYHRLVKGPLHDVCYIRALRSDVRI
jgi:SAM-dependent methyltransferase